MSHNTHALRDGPAAGVSYDPAPGYADMEFDPVAVCWRRRPPTATLDAKVPDRAPTPRSDGSGSRWAVRDARTGQPIWWFEAVDFRAALEEKRRLCAAAGWKSGWAYLAPAVDQ